MRVADYIAQRLVAWGIDTCFAVTGGGAMHLNDAFGAEPGMQVIYNHHEQACSMAADGYARIHWRPAVVNVTAGPGGINALNGVFGAFTDSVPMVVVSGQVRRDTIAPNRGLEGLRQLGDQEVRIIDMVMPITKWAALVTDPFDVPEKLDQAISAALSGRPGPVWIDVPVDVQGSDLGDFDPDGPLPKLAEPEAVPASIVEEVLNKIAHADRPVILAGTGVRCAGAEEALLEVVELLQVPLATAWTHDLVDSDHPLCAGRPGTIGTRAGNFVLQNSDLVVVVGSRLNIRQISYNWAAFAEGAEIVWIDIDPHELNKPFVQADLPVTADARVFLEQVLEVARVRSWSPRHKSWVHWAQEIRQRFEPMSGDYPVRPGVINSYHLVAAVFSGLDERHIVVSGDATACIVPFQVGRLKQGARLFSNSGCASMGFDLPAAIGAAVAGKGRPVVCFAGDGSLMMNVQELQTLAASNLDVLLVVLDNGGYLSIKQTQSNFFGREFGASAASGVTFPDFAAVASAFGLPVTQLDPENWRDDLQAAVAGRGPRVVVAPLDHAQEFEPRLKSRMRDGKITTPALDDMFPHLPDEVLVSVRESAAQITNTD